MQKFNLTFKPEGICQCKNRSTCLKLVCPLFSYKSRKCTCSCPQPCISSKSGTIVTYTMITFVLSPGINRNSQELLNLYKKRIVIEYTVAHLKSYMGSDIIPTRDHISLFSDFSLSAISFLLLFILSLAIKLYCSKLTIIMLCFKFMLELECT
ncbi:conserved hypothetical protein [Caldicellulosiruptor bescii DSM 6725]|uniref:Uncharacterized protein n=1 Tax=Caldicellulosiruptor bescii (strain ATCC BAA-1888 / DSM 6725 / KCTC 15123 / Z-1320) TaxID=521460 RepID=B9MMH4_CALBD|nr:conserved hypothetical protein [Caldicellulosiruptor bescii DSM 6725]